MCPPAGKDSRRRPSPCTSRGRAGIIPPFHDQPAFSRGPPPASPPRRSGIARRPESRHGRHGRDPVPVRRRSPARQPEDFRGARGVQRVRRGTAHRGRPLLRPRVAAVDRPPRADRCGARPHLGGHRNEPRQLARPPGGLSPARAGRDDIRGPYDAVGRRAHLPLRGLSPARPDVRSREPELRSGRRVPQRRGEPAGVARGGGVHRRDGRAGAASVPRHVERAADGGAQPPADRPLAPWRGGCHRRADRGWVHLHPGGGARRGAAVTMELRSRAPDGPLAAKWERHRSEIKLVNPANKLKNTILVVGSGLAGGAAAATLSELGYNVKCFCFQDSPRRAHSIAAQGGINAAKNYQNDGDSVYRLFYDTIKGGDFRSREANVYRLAEISARIIDQCTAQGVPFAREYGGLLANRSFGGVQVSRTFYARGQTGQQLLLGAYQALSRQIGIGTVTMYPRSEMLDLVVIDGRARGIITRDLISGAVSAHAGDAVVLATGGYSNVYYLSTNAKGCNVTAIWRAHKRGAALANPCFTQIHPTCIPPTGHHQAKLTLMSESLRNDGRIWVPLRKGDSRAPGDIPEAERDYYLERLYPSYGNLVPRDLASRRAKEVCDEGRGVGPGGHGVYLDFRDAIARLGEAAIADRYGNLFQMYQRITAESPYRAPMRIYPAPHYTMGGLWVDYNLMSTIPGLHVIGEANFSDHGANRLGASALMQGLADGYFILPYTIGDYLAQAKLPKLDATHPAVRQTGAEVADRTRKLLEVNGRRSVDTFHRELGRLMWDRCGMSRNAAGLKDAIQKICVLREEFWDDVYVGGRGADLNEALEQAGRVSDFLEFAELMCRDALERDESCGCHFREEYQTPEGEARRDDERFAYVAAWEFTGGKPPVLHKEALEFEAVHPSQRSYV